MSLCLSEGHVDAFEYPLGRISDEANFIHERNNARIVTEAQLRRAAGVSLFSDKGRKEFSKLTKQLNITTKPLRARFE